MTNNHTGEACLSLFPTRSRDFHISRPIVRARRTSPSLPSPVPAPYPKTDHIPVGVDLRVNPEQICPTTIPAKRSYLSSPTRSGHLHIALRSCYFQIAPLLGWFQAGIPPGLHVAR
jgi:hypothetical protein